MTAAAIGGPGFSVERVGRRAAWDLNEEREPDGAYHPSSLWGLRATCAAWVRPILIPIACAGVSGPAT